MWRKLLKDAFQPSPEEAEEHLKERGIDIRSILESKVEEKLNQWKWDQRFLGMAQHVAQWSKDPSTQLGAVIVDDQNRIVSVGYNGFPAQIDDTEERLNHRETKYELTIHGEMNALLFANKPVVGCTLYTVPLPPCTRCAVTFIQAGIKRVVSPPVVGEHKARWDASIQRSADLFEEAGVTFDLMEITDE